MGILTAGAIGSNNGGFYVTVAGVSYRSHWSKFHNANRATYIEPATQQVAVQ